MLVRIIVSLLYLGILLLFAVRARKRTQSIEDYYVGGRNVPTLLVVFSFYATFVSTNSFIGHSAKSHTFGLSWLLVGLVLVLMTLFSWSVIAPKFREKAGALGSVVPSDLFRLQFQSPTAGMVAAGIILFDSVFFLAAVFLGASEALSALFQTRFVYALAAVFVVQIVYTVVGGYLADVWSDSLQAVVLFVGVIALPVALVAGNGGWDATWTLLRAIESDQLAAGGKYSLIRMTTAAPLVLIIGIGLSGGAKLVADPRQLSRFYGLRSGGAAKRGVLLITAMVAVTYLFLLPIGLFARAYPLPADIAANTDAIVPYLLSEARILGPVLGTVILMALLAAAMSTIDSVLLVAAGAMQRDVLPALGRHSTVDTVTRARTIVLLLALSALVMAIVVRANPRLNLGIVELTVFAGALYAGAFLPPLLGILYWKRSSAVGAILAMIVGVVSTAAWRFVVVAQYPPAAVFPEVFVGMALGIAAFVVGSLVWRTPD